MATKIVDVTADRDEKHKLPPTQKALHMEYTDDSGNTYGGVFVIKRLNVGEVGRVGVLRAKLNDGYAEDAIEESTQVLHAMIAHLELAIVDAPEWWKPREFYSVAPINSLYEEVMAFEANFHRSARKKASGNEANRPSESRPAE